MHIPDAPFETYEEMKKNHDGFCVCVVDCEFAEFDVLIRGRAVLKFRYMDDVLDEMSNLQKKGLYTGTEICFEVFTKVEDFSVGLVNVTVYNNMEELKNDKNNS
jgi:hypothetical protein